MGKAATAGAAGETTRTAMQLARDVLELAKPRITVLELTMMLGGLALAPGQPSWLLVLGAVLGTALVVAAANGLNMVLEQDIDRLMSRTASRPVAAGRVSGAVGLGVSVVWLLAALVLLSWLTNLLTAGLGLLGFAVYAFVYTPLKRRSTLALLVGAVPGALPALMGWTAVTGTIGMVGLTYAGVLFFWQLPHFLAISVYRRDDYARAGLVVVPNVRGVEVARRQAIGYTVALFATTLLLLPVGAAGWLYAVVAVVLGVWLLKLTLSDSGHDAAAWGRRVFIASLVYLPALALGLVVDSLVR